MSGLEIRRFRFLDKDVHGAPREIRTPDLLIRSQPLYPTELGAHMQQGCRFQKDISCRVVAQILLLWSDRVMPWLQPRQLPGLEPVLRGRAETSPQ